MESVDLNGTWLAALATDDLRRAVVSASPGSQGVGAPQGEGAEPADQHSVAPDWQEVTVPGHWRDHAWFADADGPVLYTRRFTAPHADANERTWLVVDGV